MAHVRYLWSEYDRIAIEILRLGDSNLVEGISMPRVAQLPISSPFNLYPRLLAKAGLWSCLKKVLSKSSAVT